VTRDPIPDKTEDKSNLKAGGSFRAPENMPSIPFVWLLDCFSHTFSTKSDLALCQINTNSPGYYPDWCHQYLKPQFHSLQIQGSDSVEDDEAIDEGLHVRNSMIDMCIKCGFLEYEIKVFNKIPRGMRLLGWS
jgi:hypothetical protein